MESRGQLRQRGFGLPRQQLSQADRAAFGREGFEAAAVGFRLEGATSFEVLAHPPHRGHAVAKAGGNFANALALVVGS